MTRMTMTRMTMTRMTMTKMRMMTGMEMTTTTKNLQHHQFQLQLQLHQIQMLQPRLSGSLELPACERFVGFEVQRPLISEDLASVFSCNHVGPQLPHRTNAWPSVC